jgi:guanosine-3',5'-bis(diphosphate) 3'-pyrophosphohydrolase
VHIMIISEFFARLEDIPNDLKCDLFSAAAFVSKYHRGQLRDSGEPYLEHVFDVTYQLINMGCDNETICAGALHDIIEDTTVTREHLANIFGERVAFIVDACSKKPKKPFPDKTARLAEFHERFAACAQKDPYGVILPKIADRTHNLVTLHGLANDPSKQQRIAQETLKFYIPFLDNIASKLIVNEPMKSKLDCYRHKMYHLAMAYLIPESNPSPSL